MIKTFQDTPIDTSTIVRLYPAAVITLPDGDTAQVSLEWAESKFDQINVTGFVLVFDFGTHTPTNPTKKEFFYPTFDALEAAMKEAAGLF